MFLNLMNNFSDQYPGPRRTSTRIAWLSATIASFFPTITTSAPLATRSPSRSRSVSKCCTNFNLKQCSVIIYNVFMKFEIWFMYSCFSQNRDGTPWRRPARWTCATGAWSSMLNYTEGRLTQYQDIVHSTSSREIRRGWRGPSSTFSRRPVTGTDEYYYGVVT